MDFFQLGSDFPLPVTIKLQMVWGFTVPGVFSPIILIFFHNTPHMWEQGLSRLYALWISYTVFSAMLPGFFLSVWQYRGDGFLPLAQWPAWAWVYLDSESMVVWFEITEVAPE